MAVTECRTCGKEFQRVSTQGRRVRGPFTCQNCGKEYMTNRRKGEGETYCSRDCSYEDSKSWYKHRKQKVSPLPRYTQLKECDGCQTTLINMKRKYCEECKEIIEQIKKWEICTECGKAFKQERNHQRVCSESCEQSRKKRKKRKQKEFSRKLRQQERQKRGSGRNRSRAKRLGVEYEYINVMKVFERDGWKCQICGVSTPKSRRGTKHFNAPELDHRIPMSKGGGHLYSNVQCACRRCNAEKSNGSSTGQMPMFELSTPRSLAG
jgi:hypothetical protein